MAVYYATNLTGTSPGDLAALGIDQANGPTGQDLDLNNTDIAIYKSSGSVTFYWFDPTGTEAQSLPDVIRPNDYTSAGTWKILDFDADTVDGLEGTQFLRNDQVETLTYDLYSNENIYIDNNKGYYCQLNDGTTNRKIVYIDTSNQVNIGHSSHSLLLSSAGTFTFNGSTIWHSGNDGAGSGLDADTLDGSHASSFVSAENAFVAWDAGDTDIDALIPGSNFGRIYEGDADGHVVIGVKGNDTNDGFYIIDTDNGGDTSYAQLILAVSDNQFAYKGNDILTTADEGSGNGLDADTVDTLHASQFLRSDTADTMAGNLTFSSGNLQLTNGTSINEFSTDGTLAGNSDDAVPTEKAVKTYVDDAVSDTTLSTENITSNSNGTAASPSVDITYVTTNGDLDRDLVTLADGSTVGQLKYILCAALGHSADSWRLQPTNLVGGTYLDFAEAGMGCTLIWHANGWICMATHGGVMT